jgi:site-specific recombinase XerC
LDRLQRLSSSSSSSSSIDHTDCDILCTPEASSLTEASKQTIADRLAESGLWDASSNTARSSQAIVLLAKDFVDRPEVFSSLLRTDFGFPVLEAHQTRALVMAVLKQEEEEEQNEAKEKQPQSDNEIDGNDDGDENTTGKSNRGMDMGMESAGRISNEESKGPFAADNGSSDQSIDDTANDGNAEEDTPKPKTYSDKQFRSTIVNEPAVRRKRSVDDYNYGLPKDPSNLYPKLAAELDDFYVFMTQPSTYSQESPIRAATAKVYMRHARLFLGWCCQNAGAVDNKQHDRVPNGDASIFEIVPNKNKESAENIIRFVLWLRTREISVSYEANLLRGIIKLLKFRFARESTSDPLEGKNTFDDIPIIREVRKLHRDANQRQKLAPRSSDESKKWITWQDYLGVTQSTKNQVLELIRKYEALPPSKRRYPKGDTEKLHSLEKIRVAEAYQRYLILAILASVPDRQRTIRELEVGKTLRKDSETGCWEVKHGPGDYKTGKHYGERPAMQLAEELTPAIDDFLERWRPSLKPSTNALLVQSKTGKPMTGDSVFTRVVRCCFRHTGKSVNPHLLRDIIVTHVRETEASEKELEALALYMGHSIQMQRTSYDRRTLSTKVAPAVKLMKSVNKMDGD